MITIEQAKWDLDKINKSLGEVREAMAYDALISKAEELKEQQAKDGFWDDMDNAQKINRELSRIEGKIKHFDRLFSQGEDLQVLIELTEMGDAGSRGRAWQIFAKRRGFEIGDFAQRQIRRQQRDTHAPRRRRRNGSAGLGEHAV